MKISVSETQLRLIKINARRAIERNKKLIEEEEKNLNSKGVPNNYYIIKQLEFHIEELEDLVRSVDLKLNLRLIKNGAFS
ncbi:MAG: hypothetical protein GX273_09735 [Bacteroidales bacterium]|nr:hypothetical protein [Bacteroidales bacterium]